MENTEFKAWFESLPAEHPRDGKEWALEGWKAAKETSGARDAERYRWIATLQDWSDIERMCWSSTAKSAEQFKADLDRYIDAAIAKDSK